MSNHPISYVFFGTGALAESVLACLVKKNMLPKLIITKPDSPQGRHMVLTAPHIKTWANIKGIPVFQPDSLKSIGNNSPLHRQKFDVFIVASYGKIIPEEILNIPTHGVLNVHPSLLPEYRGPSPIESVLLDGLDKTGVTIIKLDSEMDHGPILVQTGFTIDAEATAGTLEVTCGQIGGDLLSQVLPEYINGNLIPKDQNHSKATTCKKITKDLGEIKLSDAAEEIRRKFRALTPWPGLYFFHEHSNKNIRVKITGIDLTSTLEKDWKANEIITSVIPEGKKEMDFESFLHGHMQK